MIIATTAYGSGAIEGFSVGVRGVLACLALALRKVRRLALSDAQRTPLHIIDYAAEQIGGHLLGAQCVDDLEERLDALLEEPALLHVNALLLEAVRPELLDAAPESLQLADLAEEVFGAGQRSLLNEGERLSLATMGAIGPLLGAMTAEQRRDMSRSLAQFSPLALWTDPGTPATVAGALVGALRSTVCMLAVVQALSNNRKLEPWHARAILDRWVEGMRRHLSLLASMPGVLVGEDIVPRGERIDLDVLDRAFACARQTSERLLSQARHSGVAVFPPRAEPGDD